MPSHPGDRTNDKAFSWSRDKHTWACWSHGCHEEFGRDAIGFIRAFTGCGMQEACNIIARALAGDEELKNLKEVSRQKSLKDLLNKARPERLETIDPACLQELDLDHQYMQERGFSPSVLRFNSVGYYGGRDSSSFMRGRIIFPIRDLDGEIVGFTGRTTLDDADERKKRGVSKWLHSGGLHRHYSLAKKSILYNCHQAKNFTPGGTIILVEGPIDVLRLQDAGIHNVCAVLGTQLSRQQEMMIRKMGARIIIPLFDADAAGEKTIKGMQDRFKQNDLLSVRTIRLPAGKDPGDLKPNEIEEILHDFVQLRRHESVSTGTDGVDEGQAGSLAESPEADAVGPGIPEEEHR